MEDSTVHAVEYSTELPKLYDDEVLTFADANHPEAKFGDVINFGDYRWTFCYIVGKDNVLIKNPDFSGAGYLSIPLEITQYLSDAVSKYSKLEVSDIELSVNDVFLTNWFGPLPEVFKEFKFRWSYTVECLDITFPNNVSKEFFCPLVQYPYPQTTHTLEDVLSFYEAVKGPRCKVVLKYNITAEHMDRFSARHSNKAEVDKQLAELDAEIARAKETMTTSTDTPSQSTGVASSVAATSAPASFVFGAMSVTSAPMTTFTFGSSTSASLSVGDRTGGGGGNNSNNNLFALKLKRIKVEQSLRYQNPVVPNTFERRDVSLGFGKVKNGIVWFEGPRSGLPQLLDSLSDYYDGFEYTTEVFDK